MHFRWRYPLDEGRATGQSRWPGLSVWSLLSDGRNSGHLRPLSVAGDRRCRSSEWYGLSIIGRDQACRRDRRIWLFQLLPDQEPWGLWRRWNGDRERRSNGASDESSS